MNAAAHPGKQVVPARACLMCGVTHAACLAQTQASRKACCGICADSDTHPIALPNRELACAEWGKLYGSPTRAKDASSEAEVERLIEKLRPKENEK